MKKLIAVSVVSLIFSIVTFGTELPPLGTATITALPCSLSLSNQNGFFDIDGNGSIDFNAYFYTSGLAKYCHISDYTSSGNQILTEIENPTQNQSPLQAPPLGISGMPFSAILPVGTPIGSGGSWYSWNHVMAKFPTPGQGLTANFTDHVYNGYLGLYYTGSGGFYYGWLGVTIDPSGNWVTFNGAGHASSPGSSIAAGSGSAVPFPLIASLIGFGLIGSGIYLKRRKK